MQAYLQAVAFDISYAKERQRGRSYVFLGLFHCARIASRPVPGAESKQESMQVTAHAAHRQATSTLSSKSEDIPAGHAYSVHACSDSTTKQGPCAL